MLQRTLGSGWGVVLPLLLLGGLAFAGLPVSLWRGVIVVGLLLSCMMIWHQQLRHFVLLPSACALISGMMLIMMNLKILG